MGGRRIGGRRIGNRRIGGNDRRIRLNNVTFCSRDGYFLFTPGRRKKKRGILKFHSRNITRRLASNAFSFIDGPQMHSRSRLVEGLTRKQLDGAGSKTVRLALGIFYSRKVGVNDALMGRTRRTTSTLMRCRLGQ